MTDNTSPFADPEFRIMFERAAEPLMRFLNDHPDNLHPHFSVIVTGSSAELLEGSICHRTNAFLRD